MLERLKGLEDDLYGKATFAGAVFFVTFYVGYLWGTHPPHDYLGYLIGRDFVNDWMGGRAVLTGHIHRLFGFAGYQAYLHSVFPGLPPHNWSYPPDILLFIWPFALLPYLWGYVAWCVAGLAGFLLAIRSTRPGNLGYAFILVCPAVVIDLMTGQNGFFTAALLIAALTQLDRRPVLAGVLIGLLTLKPQLGLLIPLALALSGRWRVFASAAMTTVLLFALSLTLFGFAAWRDYMMLALPYQRHVLEYGSELMPIMMPTAFMNMRVMGLPHEIAYVAQLPFTLLAIAAVTWTFARRRDPILSNAVLLVAAFVVTPYVFNYDMVVLGWLLWQLRPWFTGKRDTQLLLLVWSLPVTCMVIGWLGVPGSALLPAALLIRLVVKLRAQEPAREGSLPELQPNPA